MWFKNSGNGLDGDILTRGSIGLNENIFEDIKETTGDLQHRITSD
jgi:hypothetical protein